ncbi:MAG: hypothetical protein JJ971_13460 [Balneolaceae bacterium]|nr:hypothetical protein [Balneolaceae bacterium]MBO6547136.1 hypothetical protein [Balneolaceae bacterium]MBO6647916.1 hypothetical protein [Balneolaceae bacterium]
MKHLHVSIFLIVCTVVISQPALAEARCNLAPTAKITGITDNGTYRSGVTVQLSGATSTPNNCSGSITQYRWRVLLPGASWTTLYTGSNSTYTYTFEISPGLHQGNVKVELQVRNNASPNLYDTEEYDVTVSRPQRVYHLKDHLGNVRTSVDVDGDVVGYDDYYPFGLPMPGRSSHTGSNPNSDYKFTGYELDEVAGTDLKMYHANARGYDPILGRFGQVDPHYDSYPEWAPYTYTFNNPLIFTDPTGKDGDYFAEDGQYIGNDGIDDDKVYVVSDPKAVSTGEDGNIVVNAERGNNPSGTYNPNVTYVGQRGDLLNLNGNTISSVNTKNGLIGLSIYMKTEGITDNYSTIVVTGGDRTAAVNTDVGGVTGSRHIVGDGADIKSNQVDNLTLSRAANSSNLFSTSIYYPNIDAIGALKPHVHVDLRPRNTNALFKYTPRIQNFSYPFNGSIVTRHNYSSF